jgi:7-carboxy-7-deazaguanine synthase
MSAAAVTAGGDRDSAALAVSELFGPTFQGEGPSAGQRAVFVRLSGCNLNCGWCDTPYTWDWDRYDREEQTRLMTVDEVTGWVLGQDAELVVITGGEPLMQARRRLVPLVAALAAAGRRVELETNGTIGPLPALAACVAGFNVSPKLANSGIALQHRIRPSSLAQFVATGKAAFKFVVTHPGDLDEVAELVNRFGLHPVWIMPEGTSPDAVLAGLRRLADPVLAHGWNLGNRLHVLLWGDHRGR